MTLQDAIKGMMSFYRAVEAVYANLPKGKKQFDDCLVEAGDAMSELEKMQDVGVDCEHCKFYNAPTCNACRECVFFETDPSDQKKPLNYEPI